VKVAKTIYPQIGYPSNKGGFEKNFIQFVDSDSKVKSFMKINEYNHTFATVMYVRDDGLLSNYYPDFVLQIENTIYLVETKAEKDLKDVNVRQKRLAALDWLDKINSLTPDNRLACEWRYALLGENTFYGMSERGADTKEILDYAILTKAKVKGTLSDLVGIREY
jgi:type III restriction enzyme